MVTGIKTPPKFTVRTLRRGGARNGAWEIAQKRRQNQFGKRQRSIGGIVDQIGQIEFCIRSAPQDMARMNEKQTIQCLGGFPERIEIAIIETAAADV